MQLLPQTTIEEMVDAFSITRGHVIEGTDQIVVELDVPPHKAIFTEKTKRSVWDTQVNTKTWDVQPCFIGNTNFPEKVQVGDNIALTYTQVCSEPAIVAYWTPWSIYLEHLGKMKRDYIDSKEEYHTMTVTLDSRQMDFLKKVAAEPGRSKERFPLSERWNGGTGYRVTDDPLNAESPNASLHINMEGIVTSGHNKEEVERILHQIQRSNRVSATL